jgi:hypothetical protein
MIRNLKTLGLALVAVFALSAVVASAASAQQGKFTSDGPVTWIGEETGAHFSMNNALTAFGLRVECPTSTYTGHKYEETPHKFIPNNVTKVTVTPHYRQVADNKDANCRAFPGNFPVTIHMNSCDYVINLGITTGGENTYGATYDIVCPPGNEITLTAWTTDHEHTTSGPPNNVKPFCVIHVGPQVGLAGGHVRDTTNGDLDLTGSVEKIKLTRTNNTAPFDTHTVLCPESTSTIGKFDIDVTVKGFNEQGEPTSIGISE